MSALVFRQNVRSAIAGHGRLAMTACRAVLASRIAARYHSADTTPSTNPNTSSSSTSSNSSSVSASEVSHFKTLASSWWDPHGPSRLLHLMNPLRHDFIRSCLQSSPAAETQDKKYSYLDIGCGGGIFASSAARLPSTSSVTAIDPTESVIAVAQQHQRADPALNQTTNPGKLTYLNCAIEDLSQQPITNTSFHEEHAPKQYDILTLFEVLEHVPQPSSFLRLCLPHLKPNGWLIGSTISRHPVSYLTTKLVAEAPWPVGVVPRGTHDWDKYIKPDELREWFQQENRRHNTSTSAAPAPAPAGEFTSEPTFGDMRIQGVVYFPVVGWKFINGSEEYGNYFFGIQKLAEPAT